MKRFSPTRIQSNSPRIYGRLDYADAILPRECESIWALLPAQLSELLGELDTLFELITVQLRILVQNLFFVHWLASFDNYGR